MNKKYGFITIRVCIVLLGAVIGAFLLYFLGKLMLPFILGFIITLILNPAVDLLQKYVKMPRGYAVFTSIIVITAIFSAIITLLVNEIIEGFNYLSKIMPAHYNDFSTFLQEKFTSNILPFYQNILEQFQNMDPSQRGTVMETLQVMSEQITNSISNLLQSIGNGFYGFIKGLPSFATVLVFSLLAAFFISKDWHRIMDGLHKKVPSKVQNRINSIHEGLQDALFGYIKAEFKITFISAVIVYIGLLVLGIKHALTIALIIWLVDFLPYIGAILIFLPWAIYAFSTGEVFLGSGLAILYGLIVVQRQLIKPKILSSNIGISPLMTLITLYVGFKLIGFIGIVIGPLTFILLKIFYETGIFHDIWYFIIWKKAPEPEKKASPSSGGTSQ